MKTKAALRASGRCANKVNYHGYCVHFVVNHADTTATQTSLNNYSPKDKRRYANTKRIDKKYIL